MDKSSDQRASSSSNPISQQMNSEDASDSCRDRVVNAEAISTLDELWIRGEKAEVSEEQIEINRSLQEDEVLALEAIYGDNVIKFDNRRGLRSFQIHVHLAVPDDFTVSAELPTSIESIGPGGVDRSNESDDSLYSFKIQHLPPVVLTCLLPLSYPSHSPPYFTVFAQWLFAVKISRLCQMLDSIWNAHSGQEVLYKWVEWLHSSSLSLLGFEDGVRLAPYDVLDAGDERSISGSISLEIDIPLMIRYNDEKCHEDFINNLHRCVICYSEYPGTDFIKLQCQHIFCFKCMETYSNMHVKEGTVTKLVCPDVKCGEFIPSGLLRTLLGSESYDRWESLLLQRTLDLMPDVVYCPRCETACLEDEDDHAQCVKCFFSFCTFCNEGRHVGSACISQEKKLLALQKRQNPSKFLEDQKRKHLAILNEYLSLREVHRSSTQCPSCKMAISKTEGCNKMDCKYCGQIFCYGCGNKIENGYEHFKQGCPLFPKEEIMNWEMRMNRHDIIANLNEEWVMRENRREMVQHPCPICLRGNAKVGEDNHILCWSCRSHYCALCKKVIGAGLGHYNSRGCKRYSADS